MNVLTNDLLDIFPKEQSVCVLQINLCFLADCAPLGLFLTRPREGSLITVIMLPQHWTPLVKMRLNYYICLQETSLKTLNDQYNSPYFKEKKILARVVKFLKTEILKIFTSAYYCIY